MQPTDRWYQAASDLLAVVVAGYAAEGVPLPARQLVTPGVPAWDIDVAPCDGLVGVYVERQFSYAGNLAQEVIEPLYPAVGFATRGAVVSVNVLRCVPVLTDQGLPPAATAEEAAAATILGDSQLLVNTIVAAVRDGEIGGCGSLALEGWRSLGPEGGWAGGALTVRLGV